MRRLLLTALGAALLSTACQNPGMARIERRMHRLADSVRDKLGPDRLAQGWANRIDHAVKIAPEVLLDDDLSQLEDSTTRAIGNLTDELVRAPGRIGDTTLALLDNTTRRLDHLTDPPATWKILSPEQAFRRVRRVAEDWPHLLMLDKPVLTDMRDARYRTDPRDDRPEATWLERILVRLGI